MISDLYNTDILSLSATLRNAALAAPDGTARAVSKLCGSWLEIDVNVADERITDAALRVQACALGQASAAILKQSIAGSSLAELRAARSALHDMLKSGGPAPQGRFAALAALSGVAAYPARHASTLLAFDAAVSAMEDALDR